MTPREQNVQPLLDSGRLFFSSNVVPAQDIKADLMDPAKTSTYAIGLLKYLVIEKGWSLELTIAKTGHHNDGPHGHWGGFAFDGWPLVKAMPDAWLDANSSHFQDFLRDVAAYPNLYQVGLTPDAWTPDNVAAAGPELFQDSGGSHVHFGVHDETFG